MAEDNFYFLFKLDASQSIPAREAEMQMKANKPGAEK